MIKLQIHGLFQPHLKQPGRGLACALFQLHINRDWNNQKGVWPAHYFNCISTAVDVQLNQPSNNSSWDNRFLSVQLFQQEFTHFPVVYTGNQPRLKQLKGGLARALFQLAVQPQKMIETTAFQWPKHFRRLFIVFCCFFLFLWWHSLGFVLPIRASSLFIWYSAFLICACKVPCLMCSGMKLFKLRAAQLREWFSWYCSVVFLRHCWACDRVEMRFEAFMVFNCLVSFCLFLLVGRFM